MFRRGCEVSKLHGGVITAAFVLSLGLTGSSANAQQYCDIYPTRCTIYDRNTPQWSPYDQVPAGRAAISNAINGMSPGVRYGLYSPEVSDWVRAGGVDQGIEDMLRNGVDPYTAVINGTGPGGAGYTNEAARGVFNGTLSPTTVACQAMGMNC
jgi:hypothetical protein